MPLVLPLRLLTFSPFPTLLLSYGCGGGETVSPPTFIFKVLEGMMLAATAQLKERRKGARAEVVARPPTADAVAARVREEMGEAWPGAFYRQRILTLRTRSHEVHAATRGAAVEVLHTLLGVELKVGRRRLSCPDLATARYLSVFARAGCTKVAVPYDITKISRLADELESSWQRMLLLAAHHAEARGEQFKRRVAAAAIALARRDIEEAGAGTAVPQFNQETSQRRRRIG